jgi:hypothetical protein
MFCNAIEKLTKSWVRLPKSRLMRGYKMHPLVVTYKRAGKIKAQTWAEPAATAAIRARPLKMSSVRVENLDRRV